MTSGEFYYIDDQYFIDFPDPMLMQNKETVQGNVHDRPCYYAFQDNGTGLYWMIPISSQVSKYQGYYHAKIQKYKKCDTIAFGEVLGHRKAFLIQNMCPTTSKYIKNKYVNGNMNSPVRVNGQFEQELVKKAKRVLALQRQGIRLIFPDVLKIEAKLLGMTT